MTKFSQLFSLWKQSLFGINNEKCMCVCVCDFMVKSLPKNLKYTWWHGTYECSFVHLSIFKFWMKYHRNQVVFFFWDFRIWIKLFSVARVLCKCVLFHWSGFIYSFGMWKKNQFEYNCSKVCVLTNFSTLFGLKWTRKERKQQQQLQQQNTYNINSGGRGSGDSSNSKSSNLKLHWEKKKT